MKKLGSALVSSQKAFDGAVKKLKDGKGSMFSKVEKLKKLGANTTKDLVEVEEINHTNSSFSDIKDDA